ncbi:MAG TPA: radical SAM protein, partial [Deltaproteobacteria bacterium]|nr:radical SAM protein [Deltaproteobacteria bacterium]
KFLRRLDALPRPDAVLVTSMMTYWYPGVFEAIRLIRQRLEGVPVILGGVYATLCHGHARLFSGADMVVAGESEVRVLGIMQSLWGGMPDFIPDDRNLDSFPYPSYDLMENLPSVCIQTSRGCPYRCTYCASSYLSPARRLREPARVVDEVVHWHSRYNVHDFAFIDDALLVGRTRALEMLGALARRSLDVRFHCPNAVHAREIDEEVACLMRQAGVVTIRLGLETAKPAAQIETGGKVTNDEFLRAVDSLHRAGYTSDEIGVYVLCGLPGQDLEEVMRTVEFVQGSGARPYLAEYSPVPQTALWESAVRESPFPLDEEPLFHNNTLFPCANEWFTTGVFEKIRRTARSSVGPGVSGTWSRWP